MGLQDLTPQLRTRLSRVERIVGLFVTLATLLLIAGFAYYIYHTAQRKGWFLTKIAYSTSINNATGLRVGEPVKLMGFDVGTITHVIPNEPWDWYGVTVYFEVKDPYYGYIWTDSKVKVAAADFLGNRYLEIVKGREGMPTEIKTETFEGVLKYERVKKQISDKYNQTITALETEHRPVGDTNQLAKKIFDEVHKSAKAKPDLFYIPLSQYKAIAKTNAYWLEPMESPAVTDRLEGLVDTVEKALPSILSLTNRLNDLLTNSTSAAARADGLLSDAKPLLENVSSMATNLMTLIASIKTSPGGLGEWLIPTNLNVELENTLVRAQSTLENTDTNLSKVVAGLDETLLNLANLTSNLNSQVQVNTNILSNLSAAVVHADELVQGLKRHWLLRSAFKTNQTGKVTAPPKKFVSPRQAK